MQRDDDRRPLHRRGLAGAPPSSVVREAVDGYEGVNWEAFRAVSLNRSWLHHPYSLALPCPPAAHVWKRRARAKCRGKQKEKNTNQPSTNQPANQQPNNQEAAAAATTAAAAAAAINSCIPTRVGALLRFCPTHFRTEMPVVSRRLGRYGLGRYGLGRYGLGR